MKFSNLKKNIILGLTSISLCLLFLEIGFRAYHLHVTNRTNAQPAQHPEMIYTIKPHAFPGINAHGFRDREHSQEKHPDSTRLLIIGDSITRGYGIDDTADRYTNLLEDRLNAAGENYEVINCGMDQYATFQQASLLENWGVTMQPDRVIISYVLNDPTADGNINDFFQRHKATSLALYWISSKMRKIYSRYSESHLIPNCQHFDYFSKMHCDSSKWEIVRASFRKIRDLSIAHNFPVLLVIFPALDRDPKATFQVYLWTAVHQRVLAAAAENGFDTLDLLQAFSRYNPVDLKIRTSDRLHPNERGHRIAADAIFKKISSLNPNTSPKNSQITRGIDDE